MQQTNPGPLAQAPGIMVRAKRLGTLFVLALGAAASACADAGPRPLKVEWHQDRLGVDADHVPFRELLAAVARRTGLEFRGLALLEGTASVRFANRTLRDGLEALLAPYDYAVVEEQASGDNGRRVMVIIVGRRADPDFGTSAHSMPGGVVTTSASDGSRGSDHYREVEQLAEQGDLEALREAAASGDLTTRALSMQRLAHHDPELARRIAIDAAGSEDTTERVLALQVLGGLDSVDAANALVVALADPEAAVRQAAVVGLMGQRSPVAARYLELALKDDTELVRLLSKSLVARKDAFELSSDKP
jgi:hypothetical protein